MKSDDGRNAMFVTGPQHVAVVFQDRLRELTLFGFDAGPLDREAVGVESQLGQQGNILAIAMVVVAGVSGRFDIR